MSKDIVFMSGLPGAGKSTLIDDDPAHQLVCPDDIRLAWGHTYCASLEPMVHAVCQTMVHAAMIRGREIAVDECFTRYTLLKPYLDMAKQYGYTSRLVVMTTPVHMCIDRAKWREDGTDWEAVIEKKATQWIKDYLQILGEFDSDSIQPYPYPITSLVEDIRWEYQLF